MVYERKEKMKTKALKLLEQADEETINQMFRFLHNEKHIRDTIFGVLTNTNEKELERFIIFFDNERL